MSRPTVFTILAGVLLLTGCLGGRRHGAKGVAAIRVITHGQTGDEAPAHHKYHDVAVYRTNDALNYTVYFYSNFSDTLFCYQASLSAEDGLEKAAYKWLNDTMASVRLYIPHSKKSVKFKVYGVGHDGVKTSGLITE